MINEMNIKATAEALLGEDIEPSIIASALRKIKRMLKSDYDKEVYDEAVEYLAALYAVRDYLVIDKAASPTEISTGEVKIKNELSVSELERVIRGETAYLSDCLNAPDFVFVECEYTKKHEKS